MPTILALDPITFRVDAVPVAQPRPRAVNIVGQARMVSAFASHPVSAFKATVRCAYAAVRRGAPLEGPLSITIVFVMPRAKNMVWKTRPMPRVPYAAAKNDWDNLGKSVCDALNKFAWNDDGQICKATVERWIAAGDEAPHCVVTIQQVGT